MAISSQIPSFARLVRFVPKSNRSLVLLGEPLDEDVDVGAALHSLEDVRVNVFSGESVLSPGSKTSRVESIARLLSPLSQGEVGTIRCIGLNYVQHAKEVKMAIPEAPTLFLKPDTSLADPWPVQYVIPKFTSTSGSTDYESELAIVIGRNAKDVSEEEAMDYVLGYTAANDVSDRDTQFGQSQWCFSKGFDGSCPLGPVIASTKVIPNPSRLRVRGLKNGKVMQQCDVDDLIFSVPRLVSFCSQGTTLKAGTVILTGTPAGVGHSFDPKEYLHMEDEFAVEITPYIGTLYTQFIEGN